MIYNKLYKSKPFIIHAPGNKKDKIKYNNINKIWRRFAFVNNNLHFENKNIKILTCNNTNEKGSFEKSLDSLGYKYKVLKDSRQWKNTNKIKLFYEEIKKSKESHVLGCDSFDVMCIKEIKIPDCQMIIGTESKFFPDDPYVEQEKTQYSFGKFLNSGCWIGEKDVCLEFFELCMEELDKKPILKDEVSDNSDQLIFHKAYSRLKQKVTLDYKCEFFQTVTFCGLETLFPTKSIL